VIQPAKSKIGIVGALRGVAALSVCWYHFVHGQNTALKWTGEYGWLGVHMFFVISGFIIPYSLLQYRYSIRDYFRFLGKRLARLHPPYLASIAVVVLLGWAMMLVPRWNAPAPDVSVQQLFAHFFYLNDLLGKPWLNVVYWTLSIELQWYLLIGIAFPLLANRRWTLQVAGAALMVAGHLLVPKEQLVLHIVPVFLIGVFVFQYRVGLSSVWRMLVSIAAMFALMKVPIGMPVASLSAATGLVIAFITLDNRLFGWLGEVSYSLYLLHIPIGLRFIDFTSRLPYSGSYLILLDLLAVGVSLWASHRFFKRIEGPSQRWSSAIKIKPKAVQSVRTMVPATAAGD
jgi:peptidoglycan/LPS O-acetylase OafA/YrhL